LTSVLITDGPRSGEQVELDREISFGRTGTDIAIIDPELSRRHAVIRPVPGGVEVEDLGSLNGTTVDGERIEGKVTAGDGAVIRMGITALTVQAPIAQPDVTRISQAVAEDPGRTVFRPRPAYQPTVVGQAAPVAAPGSEQPTPADAAGPAPGDAGPPPGHTGPPPGHHAGPPPGHPGGRGKPPLFVRVLPGFILRRLGRRPPGSGPPGPPPGSGPPGPPPG
jgi:hypothetical protein